MAKYIKTKTGVKTQAYLGKYPDGQRAYKWLHAPNKNELAMLEAKYKIEFKKKYRLNPSLSEMTVETAINQYIDNKDAVLSPSTIYMYKCQSESYLSALHSLKLDDLTTQKVQAHFNELARTKSPKTLRNVLGLLKSAIKEVDPSLVFNITLPQKIKPDITVPSHDDIKKFVEVVKGKPLEIAILLGASGGLRRSEVCALTVEDINVSKNTITINKALVPKYNEGWVTKSTKSTSGKRILEVPGNVITRIIELSPAVGRLYPHTPNTLTKQFAAVRDKTGLHNIRFHDLRHYNASVMLALGIPDKYAMKRMGHATPNMLKNVYQHIMRDKEIETTNIINEQMSKLLE